MVQLNYVKQNREYQRLLDSVYGGYIVPVDCYVNFIRATIKHHCLKCSQTFYARPNLLIQVASQRHVCYLPYGDTNGIRLYDPKFPPPTIRTWKNKLPQETIQAIYSLADSGLSQSKIADQLGVSRPTIIKYLKERGTDQ